jgi:hypothetical protein
MPMTTSGLPKYATHGVVDESSFNRSARNFVLWLYRGERLQASSYSARAGQGEIMMRVEIASDHEEKAAAKNGRD